ncbi:MAG: putative Ig domain-containing protein [Planctomycetaceae bacterium]|nr:putative Ig domain-containing protein [Planctomycetaceae bacterium]
MKITNWLASIFPKTHLRKSSGIRASAWVETLENRVLLSSQNVLVQSLTTLEGTTLDDIPIQFALTEGTATFEEMGYFLFNADGTVDGSSPGDADFSDKVLARGTTVFQQGAPLGSTSMPIIFNGGDQIGVYFCHNLPASQAANEIDRQELSANSIRLGFEETASLWPETSNGIGPDTRRFDDAVIQATIGDVDTFGSPILDPIADQTTNEEELFELQITATNPEGPDSDLRYRLDTELDGATVDEVTGLLTWTPTEEQGPGSFQVVVTAFNSTRPDATTSQQFTINVAEVNTAPLIDPIADMTINEGELFTTTATASNPFGPDTDIRFRLDQAPTGVTIDEMTGEINWTPTETQGPGQFDVVVSVFNATDPADSNSERFTLVVQEVNVAPVIANIPDQDATQEQTLTVQIGNFVTDADRPANRLSYSLLNNSFATAQINGNTGVFTWTPSTSDAPATYSFTVLVVDNGTPQLSAMQTFLVTVMAP